MGVLSLLAEIYNLPNLKMNLKFDIEVANVFCLDCFVESASFVLLYIV
jgi:CCR4-NOT transcription complex subunit 1